MIGSIKKTNEISYPKEIYSINTIITAIEAYKHICKITYFESGNIITCRFSDCKYNSITTIKEFSNFLIEIMNCRTTL